MTESQYLPESQDRFAQRHISAKTFDEVNENLVQLRSQVRIKIELVTEDVSSLKFDIESLKRMALNLEKEIKILNSNEAALRKHMHDLQSSDSVRL